MIGIRKVGWRTGSATALLVGQSRERRQWPRTGGGSDLGRTAGAGSEHTEPAPPRPRAFEPHPGTAPWNRTFEPYLGTAPSNRAFEPRLGILSLAIPNGSRFQFFPALLVISQFQAENRFALFLELLVIPQSRAENRFPLFLELL